MAGIWELWQDAEGNQIQSCSIITTEASGAMRDIHTRMPVTIAVENYAQWLDCRAENTDIASDLINNPPANYQYYTVSTAVNNSRHEGRDLIEQIDI